MTLIRRVFAATAVLVTVSASAACSSGSTSASAPAPKKTNVVVGVLPAVNTASLYLAIKEGYFAQAGLVVTPRQLATSTEAIPSMLHGSIDISSGNMDSYLAAQASGVVSLRILNETALCSPGTLAVLTTPRTGITNAAQLAGKTVAVALHPNIQTLTINRLLGAAAAPHYVVVPFADMGAELAAGKVDAIATLEPYISAVEHTDGAKVVLDQCGGANVDLPLGGYFATASWAARYPDTARAFQRALDRAQALADSDPALLRQVLPTFMKVTPQIAAKVGLPRLAVGLNQAAIQEVADLGHSGGELKRPLDVSPLLFR
ncbi:MAG: ABC transporter substrate-binding protein [Streptosporangiaceae bacterium]|nr:ABC transporter substrate-binding protein [Streptosporangiaceae bacterium]